MKTRRPYDVFLIRDGSGCYASQMFFAGNTWAVSEAQAENNVRHRNGDKQAYLSIGDYLDEGSVTIYYKAFLEGDERSIQEFKANLSNFVE